MNIGAFFPQGLTVLVAASSSTGAAATRINTGNVAGAMLSNPCTVPLYVAIGSSSVAAAQPTTAVPIAGLCIPSGQTMMVGVAPSSSFGWLSAVTSAGAAAPGLFVTPGQMGL